MSEYLKDLNIDNKTADVIYELENLSVEILIAISVVYSTKIKDYKKAEEFLLIARKVDPGNWKTLANLCDFYYHQLNLKEALRWGKESVIACQGKESQATYNYAVALSECGHSKQSIEFYENTILLNSELYLAKYNLACEKIKNYDFENGWKEYQVRYKAFAHLEKIINSYDPIPYWNGEDIKNKNLLLVNEQGKGDFIFGMRYLPELIKNKAKIFVDGEKAIHNILSNTKIKGIKKYNSTQKIDYIFSVMSLPCLLKKEKIETGLYDNIFEKHKKSKRKNKLKVGLTFFGNHKHPNDYRRSMHLSKLKPILDNKNFEIHLIQKKENLVRDWKKITVNIWDYEFKGIDRDDELKTYTDTLRILNDLDVLVTIDTSIAHLSGAIDMPTFVFLDHGSDYRWGFEREKTSWYPSWKIFKQNELYNWDKPIEECLQALLNFK